MVKTDILLDDDIDAVPGDGSLNITTGRDATPDIKLSPNSAAMTLGGGDGEFSDGDIRLHDRPGDDGESDPRIHLTGGTGSTDEGTRVRVHGRDGLARLGATSADDPDVELRSALGQLRLGGGAGTPGDDDRTAGNVRLDGENENPRVFLSADGAVPPNETENAAFLTTISDEYAQFYLKRVGEDLADATVSLNGGSGQLALGSKTQSGRLAMFRQGNVGTVIADGHDAALRLGGAGPGEEPGVSGTAAFENADGETTVSIDSDDSDSSGGGLSVGNDAGTTTAEIDGGEGSLTLGGDTENGRLSLEDGAGMVVDLEAEDGSVTLEHHDPSKGEIGLELEPEAGIFSVFDGNGDPVFRIDTQSKSIEKARGYSQGVIGTGKPSSPGQGNGQGQGQGNSGGQSGGN